MSADNGGRLLIRQTVNDNCPVIGSVIRRCGTNEEVHCVSISNTVLYILPVRAVVGTQQENHLSGGCRVTKQCGIEKNSDYLGQDQINDWSLQFHLNCSGESGRIADDRRGLGKILEPIQTYYRRHNLPPLTVLVVKEEDGLPGEGFTEAAEGAQARVFVFDWFKRKSPSPKDFSN